MNTKTKESMKYLYRGLCNIILTLVVMATFWVIWNNRLNELLYQRYLNKGNLLMVFVYTVVAILFLYAFGGYKIGVNKKSHVVLSQVMAMLCCNMVELVITILMVGKVAAIGHIISAYLQLWILQSAVLFVITIGVMSLYRHIFPPYRMLHIYGDYSNNLTAKMNARDDKYIIDAEISCHEPLEEVACAISRYDAVLINDVPSGIRNKILKECFDQSKRVYFTPKISDIIVKNSDELNLFDTPIYFCRNLGLSGGQRFLKRCGDIIISLIGIILTSPIMLVTAIAIHHYDKGPVLYRQTRCTIGGKEFEVLKFRSMIIDAEADGKARLATENDNRITPVGKFIRATRIDELPQFFNILKGDMSIVGPRPERPEINEEYCKEVPEFAYRLRVKAGLTGYAQVYGKYNTTSYDKLKLDMIYVQKCSILLDIQLILLTLRVIFTKESTEGLEVGQTNASTGNK